MRARTLFVRGILIAALVIGVDQVTKWWILESVMQPPSVIEVTAFFNMVLAWNRGVSFGLFNNDSGSNVWVFTVVALAISAVMLFWLWRANRRTICVAVGLVVGGALGNVIDRLIHGAVVDFLDFHAWGYHWPAFNIADSAITIGAAILIFDSLFDGSESPKRVVEKHDRDRP